MYCDHEKLEVSSLQNSQKTSALTTDFTTGEYFKWIQEATPPPAIGIQHTYTWPFSIKYIFLLDTSYLIHYTIKYSLLSNTTSIIYIENIIYLICSLAHSHLTQHFLAQTHILKLEYNKTHWNLRALHYNFLTCSCRHSETTEYTKRRLYWTSINEFKIHSKQIWNAGVSACWSSSDLMHMCRLAGQRFQAEIWCIVILGSVSMLASSCLAMRAWWLLASSSINIQSLTFSGRDSKSRWEIFYHSQKSLRERCKKKNWRTKN